MPTHPRLILLYQTVHKRVTALLCCAAVICMVTACSAPRIAGRSESEQQLGSCESVLYAASDYSNRMKDTSAPLIERYEAANQVQHTWLDVAIQCPQRFAEGTLYSAQAQYVADQLASALGITHQPLTVTRLDDVQSLSIGADALAELALAEDRAGFATEVLSGRITAGEVDNADSIAINDDGSLLATSNNHKETASQLMQLASGTSDLRRKVYATDDLLKHSATMDDPSTGLQANTIAVIEINCAREELEGIQQKAQFEALASSQTELQQLQAGLLQLSMLIATHTLQAFELGYPYADFALFQTN